jgi:hypothetical protein
MDSRTFLPASSSNHHRAKVGELPQRASRDLLESCANARQQVHLRRGGQRAADAESATTASPRSSPVARPEIARDDEAHLHRRQLTVSAKPRATFAPVLQPSGDFQAEAESLNKTFAQRLVRRTVNAIRHLQPSANNETQANECLSEQWSTTLDGAAVSSNSLVEIIAGGMNAIRMKQSKDMMNESSVVAHPRPGARHETSSAHSPRSLDSEMILRRERHLSSHSSGTDVDAEASVITDRDSAPRLRADAPTPREFLPASFSNRHPRVGSFDDPFGDEREGGKEAVGFSNVERIAPPALAPSLPSLTPSPEEAQTDVTSVLPLASEIARQGARKEAESPEDLDALAAKIKFILDEQARRHGIDV